METERTELFSAKLYTGRRTYFFDVKITREGYRYVMINETKRDKDNQERFRIMVFEENVDAFMESLKKAVAFIKENPKDNSNLRTDIEEAQ